MTLVEICVEDADGVRAARRAGADRVEICRDLNCGGLTPGMDTILEAVDAGPDGGVQVLVRPRPGDFIHDEAEVAGIAAAIRAIRAETAGPRVRVGFVVGVLAPDRRINVEAAKRLRGAAGDAPLTFHRAFDLVPDQMASAETLIELGYQRVLTTGGDPAVAQPAALRDLIGACGNDLVVLASGGLRSANVARIVARCGAREVHMRAPGAVGGTDEAEIRRILAELGRSTPHWNEARPPSSTSL